MLQSRRSRYTVSMARGWESKSVEDQIGAAEAERELRNRQQLSTGEREQNERTQSLLLSRSLILSRIKAARDPRYRAQLKVSLDQLDQQLREITDNSRGD
jgi:hypothetical protein